MADSYYGAQPPTRNGNGNGNGNGRQVLYADKTNLAFNAATLVGAFGAAIVGAFIVSVWLVGKEQRIIDGINAVDKKLENLTDRQARFEEYVQSRTADRFTKTDQRLFCYRLERVNAQLGIKCPEE